MKVLGPNMLKYPLRENTKMPLILIVLIPTLIVYPVFIWHYIIVPSVLL